MTRIAHSAAQAVAGVPTEYQKGRTDAGGGRWRCHVIEQFFSLFFCTHLGLTPHSKCLTCSIEMDDWRLAAIPNSFVFNTHTTKKSQCLLCSIDSTMIIWTVSDHVSCQTHRPALETSRNRTEAKVAKLQASFEASPASIVDLPHIHYPQYLRQAGAALQVSYLLRTTTTIENDLSIINADMQTYLRIDVRCRLSPWSVRTDWTRWNEVGAYRYPFRDSARYLLAIRTRQICMPYPQRRTKYNHSVRT